MVNGGFAFMLLWYMPSSSSEPRNLRHNKCLRGLGLRIGHGARLAEQPLRGCGKTRKDFTIEKSSSVENSSFGSYVDTIKCSLRTSTNLLRSTPFLLFAKGFLLVASTYPI
jgi:hypothetical protein